VGQNYKLSTYFIKEMKLTNGYSFYRVCHINIALLKMLTNLLYLNSSRECTFFTDAMYYT